MSGVMAGLGPVRVTVHACLRGGKFGLGRNHGVTEIHGDFTERFLPGRRLAERESCIGNGALAPSLEKPIPWRSLIHPLVLQTGSQGLGLKDWVSEDVSPSLHDSEIAKPRKSMKGTMGTNKSPHSGGPSHGARSARPAGRGGWGAPSDGAGFKGHAVVASFEDQS
jgi:hypothetical protein